MKYVAYKEKKDHSQLISDVIVYTTLIMVGGIIGCTLAFNIIADYIEITLTPPDGRSMVLTKP